MSQTTITETSPLCRDMFFLARDWEDWRDSLRETISVAREIDPSDPHVLGVVEDMIDFLTGRVHSGSPDEARVADIWSHASREERRMLARCFMEDIESRPTSGP